MRSSDRCSKRAVADRSKDLSVRLGDLEAGNTAGPRSWFCIMRGNDDTRLLRHRDDCMSGWHRYIALDSRSRDRQLVGGIRLAESGERVFNGVCPENPTPQRTRRCMAAGGDFPRTLQTQGRIDEVGGCSAEIR